MKSDIEIARAATLRPIVDIAAKLDIPEEALSPFGRHVAKVDPTRLGAAARAPGKLVLVTAISPTPAGEGKTTATVGLGDALTRLGRRAAIALREPSLGPCFGMKGGAAGGGLAQVAPMEAINLHFTGDFHAVGAANNLLSAMLDNHLYWGNEIGIDLRRIFWRRALDMNDRGLRQIVSSLGGVSNGFPREDGFDITVASEVMAVFCLATDLADLERRLGAIVVAQTRDKAPVTAADLKAAGAMTVLLRDAFAPNLVQTLEGTPAFVHGGPFANIAHGCNSLIATRTALSLADVLVTEAGFGADLGAEKFFDIKCRQGGLTPCAVVLVATVRALKMHGGIERRDLGREDLGALKRGFANLDRHLANLNRFGLKVVVAVNHFAGDGEAELAAVIDHCRARGVEAHVCRHWAQGGAGAEDLARAVARIVDDPAAGGHFRTLYADEVPLADKIRTVAQTIYGAGTVEFAPRAKDLLAEWQEAGHGHLPVCMAKTQYSFSTDPAKMGAPEGHRVAVREVRLSAGAGFVVAVCGDIMTMPGLPRHPAAEQIHIGENGETVGLF